MKKTVFAAEVFGLMAMLPLVVILEMNHLPHHLNTPSVSVIKTENAVINSPVKTTDKLSGEALSLPPVTFLYKTAW